MTPCVLFLFLFSITHCLRVCRDTRIEGATGHAPGAHLNSLLLSLLRVGQGEAVSVGVSAVTELPLPPRALR